MSAIPSPACAAPLTEKQKMLSGALCHASDTELQRESATTQAWLARYNAASGAPSAPQWHALLAERLAAVGAGSVVRAPFHCGYGFNIRLGRACSSTSTVSSWTWPK